MPGASEAGFPAEDNSALVFGDVQEIFLFVQ